MEHAAVDAELWYDVACGLGVLLVYCFPLPRRDIVFEDATLVPQCVRLSDRSRNEFAKTANTFLNISWSEGNC